MSVPLRLDTAALTGTLALVPADLGSAGGTLTVAGTGAGGTASGADLPYQLGNAIELPFDRFSGRITATGSGFDVGPPRVDADLRD